MPGALIELWQANAAGRYIHERDDHPAPLDPNFTGAGRCLTDGDGALPVRVGQAGRLSVAQPPQRLAARPHPLLGVRARVHRPAGDADVLPRRPAVPFDPIFQSIRDPHARERLISAFDWETTTPEWALGYRFDIVLGGRDQTPVEA